MKKLVCLTLVVLFANLLVSCAAAAPKLVDPGGKIGDMTVENHVSIRVSPSIWTYCISGTNTMRNLAQLQSIVKFLEQYQG